MRWTLETVSFRANEIAASVPATIAARGRPFSGRQRNQPTRKMQNVEPRSTFVGANGDHNSWTGRSAFAEAASLCSGLGGALRAAVDRVAVLVELGESIFHRDQATVVLDESTRGPRNLGPASPAAAAITESPPVAPGSRAAMRGLAPQRLKNGLLEWTGPDRPSRAQ